MAFEFPATTLYDRTGSRFDFSSLDTLVEFLENESKEWGKIAEELPENLRQSKFGKAFSSVHSLYSIITRLKNLLSENAVERDVDNAWQGFLEQHTHSFADPRRSNSSWISITNPVVMAWRIAMKYGQRTGNAFFEFLCNKVVKTPASGEELCGALLAYEYQMQGGSGITSRRVTEEASFEQLRNQLLQRKNQLFEEISGIQNDHAQWFKNASAQWSQSQQERQSIFEEQQSTHQQNYAYQHQSQQEQFAQFMRENTQKIADLEQTYQEKLRLQGPAQYWKASAKTFLRQGRIFGAMLLAVLVGSISIVFTLLYQWIANGTLHIFNLQNLQGVLLFASLVSLIAYTVKTFARLTFSSFHLQRDAEEREQLTHLYLALGNQGDIDADSRKILYQALFSRSETGLLHKEQGPTMPSLAEAVMQTRPR